MRARVLQLLAFVVVALVSSCGGGDSPSPARTSRTVAALQSGGVVPIPCDSTGTAWGGTAVDLLVADAMVSCSASDQTAWWALGEGGGSTHDSYLIYVRGLMADAETEVGLVSELQSYGELQTWKMLREDKSKNCDPDTLMNGLQDPTVDATLEPRAIPYGIYSITPSVPIQFANVQLRTPAFNLCIAQSIRELVPGASSAAALLLSESDQRMLVETIRERAQMAMLGFAVNGVAISSMISAPPPTPQPDSHYLPYLQNAALACGTNPDCVENKLKMLGRDFAAAVQLHSMVSEELAYLLARSRSARTERGGDAQTRAEEVWGSGSWHQRLLAAMAGGDPLANPDMDPWDRPDGLESVYVLFDRPGTWTSTRWWYGSELGRDWPTKAAMPFVQTDISEPQVRMLLNLARSVGRVQLTLPPDPSCEVDIEQSGEDLYQWIEAEVRARSCYDQSGGSCSDVVEKPTLPFPEEKYLLWERYRIHPDHARTLARYLADNLDPARLGVDCGTASSLDADERVGAQFVSGSIDIEKDVSSAGHRWLHISNQNSDGDDGLASDVSFSDRPLADIAPAYSRNAVQRFPYPWEFASWARAADQGFTGTCPLDDSLPQCIELSLDSERLMGAMAAMSATRLMLMSSIGVLKGEYSAAPEAARLDDYFAHAEDILRVIDGSIGADSVALRPVVEPQLNVNGEQILAVPYGSGDYVWRFNVSFSSAGDAFWDGPDGAEYRICAIAHPAAANLTVSPGSRFLDTTIETLLDGNDVRCAQGAFWEDQPSYNSIQLSYDRAPKGWSSNALRLPEPDPSNSSSTVFTLIAKRTGPDPDAPPTYRLIGSSVAFGFTGNPNNGQYLAYGGTLGNQVSRAIQGRVDNPTVHRYDGFGLPSDWVPPFTAELIGGAAGESSVDRYLLLAKSAGEEATAAVASAMDMMVAEHADDAAMAAATTRSQEGLKEEKQKLCGSGNADCKLEVVKTEMDASWFDVLPPRPTHPMYEATGMCIDDDAVDRDYCLITKFSYEMALDMLGMSVEIAVPVLDRINDPMPPAFSEYSGGSLQSAFIAQWGAVRAMRDRMAALAASSKTAWGHVLLAHAAIDDANEVVRTQCSDERMADATAMGKSWSCSLKNFPETVQGEAPEYENCVVSYSTASLLAQRNACEDAIQASESEVLANSVMTANLDVFSALATSAAQVVDAAIAVQQASATVSRLGNEASLAQSRYVLEEKLAAIQQTTSFGLYRRYRSYDIWRAKAMVDNARLYALAARRAIEARYVVDLSTLTQPEAFVQSPATWADEVYEYDLSLPAAVGLSVGTATVDGIYPNKVSDYVGNLESFVMGYAASRPAAVASNEIEVVNLKGLKQGEPALLPVGDDIVTVYADMGEWSLHCPVGAPGGEGWVAVPTGRPASLACIGDVMVDGDTFPKPDRARIEYTLDPWGRMNDSVANEPYARRFNGRWDLMAVNFAGTGIKDCDQAPDPYACYSEGFIRYSLSHVGPAWVTDYDGIWRTLGVPIGRIEGAKALASELWLDPLKDGWNTSYMSAVSRTELQLRPLGGAYELEFVITPEIDIDRIERVQLLIGSSYWVKQD